jgi:hypothetical protein
MKTLPPHRFLPLAAATLLAAAQLPAHAQSKGGGGGSTTPVGVITIDQAKAEAGGVTPGDAPGFPVTISLPGSYRLAGNLTVADPNLEAIQVQTDNVAIDLGGFAIVGGTSCTGTMAAYVCTPASASGNGVRANNRTLVTVRNGAVRGFQVGVWVGANSRVEDLNVAESRFAGIIAAAGGFVARNVVSGGEYGIQAGGVVRDNTVDNIRGYAMFLMGQATSFVGNSVSRAAGPGIWATSGNAVAGVSGNVISNANGPAISGGVSLGDGQSNLCNGVKC